jgi:hypothetical protein
MDNFGCLPRCNIVSGSRQLKYSWIGHFKFSLERLIKVLLSETNMVL